MGNKESSSKFKLTKEEFAQYQRELNLNQAQLKKLVASFAKMADKEGRVSKAVFRKTIEEYYGGSDGTLLRMIMTLFDKDNSSDIDFREFTLALSYATNSELSDAIDLAFQCFDLNGDGGISREELRAVFRTNTRLNKYVNVFKRTKPLDEIQLSPSETLNCHDEADAIFDSIQKADARQIRKEEFLQACNSDPELKKKVANMMLGASQSKDIFA